MSRETFTVSPTGVGRKDWSQDVQVQVEPLVRGHQQRDSWSARYLLPYPGEWYGVLTFIDENNDDILYVPDTPKYVLYDFSVEASQNILVSCGLAKIEKIETLTDPVNIIEWLFRVYGYGKQSVNISRGYVCEPGYTYLTDLNACTEQPYYYLTTNTFGLDDTLVSG
jgi:hypothetical protein